MMACGHAPNASMEHEGDNDVCALCFLEDPLSATTPIPDPYLDGRDAECVGCGKVSVSSMELPFFQYRYGTTDLYYCGCQGWNLQTVHDLHPRWRDGRR